MRILRFIKYTPLLLIGLLLSCNKTDWNENYKEKQKSPFGNYVIYNEAANLLDGQKVELLEKHIYDHLLFYIYDDVVDEKKNYVIIKSSNYKRTNQGKKQLLDFVYKGNTAFLALNSFSDSLQIKLGFTNNNLDKKVRNIHRLKELKGTFYLKNDAFQKTKFTFDRNIRRNYFLQYNDTITTVLGTIEVGGEQVPNFIKIAHGKGSVLLHTQPIAFTNYNLLNGNEAYAANVFSYIPNNPTLWDPLIRSSKYDDRLDEEQPSIFSFFLAHQTLTWFLLVSLAGVILFMVFNARRKQRPIPVIEPLKNSTVEFTQTIANLYLKEQDHKNLVDKKIAYFLEKVRSKYLLNTTNLNKDFIDKLAAKSGNDINRTKYLINTIILLNKKTECTEEELLVLHKMIKNFFNT
ncbi:DUF4350 domain-containing protein [Polaribacter septentrionalilitoris]|uniref:DUF4350 domain-containing protein n=1 Tax=Polaribacter septentrionalilitoris TaxID=2494657 RepID=UPI0013590575|nr:DUF4350 domain-containing protein [Polaribacter septentrionalilitoris]